MKKYYLLFVLIAGSLYAQVPTPTFVHGLETDAINGGVYLSATASELDSEGNLIVLGKFNGEVDVDPNLTTYLLTKDPNSPEYWYTDFFLAKYNSNGGLIWAMNIGDQGHITPMSLAIDQGDNISVAGLVNGTVDFDPSDAQQIIETNGKTNGFVVLYSSIGNFKWLKSINTNGSLLSNLKHVHNTSTTNNWTMVSGNFLGQITFVNSFPNHSTTISSTANNQFEKNSFLAVIDSQALWSTITPLLDTDSMTIETLDLKINEAVLATIGLGDGTMAGIHDFEIRRFDLSPLGSEIISLTTTGTSKIIVNDVDLDANDNVYITGYYKGTVTDNGTIVLNDLSLPLQYNGFMIKTDPLGSVLWARTFESVTSSSSCVPQGIVAENNNVYLFGGFSGKVDLINYGGQHYYLENYGPTNSFMVRFDDTATFDWAHRFESTTLAPISSLNVSGSNFYLFGCLRSLTEFNPNPMQSTTLDITNGSKDFFIAKYGDIPAPIGPPPFTRANNPLKLPNTLEVYGSGSAYTLHYQSGDLQTESHYQIFSNSGQVITTGILNATGTAFQKYLDLSSLSSGVYVVRVIQGGSVQSKRILVAN